MYLTDFTEEFVLEIGDNLHLFMLPFWLLSGVMSGVVTLEAGWISRVDWPGEPPMVKMRLVVNNNT